MEEEEEELDAIIKGINAQIKVIKCIILRRAMTILGEGICRGDLHMPSDEERRLALEVVRKHTFWCYKPTGEHLINPN